MSTGLISSRGGRAAVWLAVLAVLALLAAPVLAGRAHASAPSSKAMGQMAPMAGSTPCHRDGAAACSAACHLASQLLSPSGCDPVRPVGEAGRAPSPQIDLAPDGAWPERSTPPPR